MNLFSRIRQGWMAFVHVLGRVQTVVLLSLIYHLSIGPISLISRALRQQFLRFQAPKETSFSEPIERISTTIEQAERQF